VLAPAATARAVDGGCVGQGHGRGAAPWRSGDDEGKQRRCAVAFDGSRQALELYYDQGDMHIPYPNIEEDMEFTKVLIVKQKLEENF
jgi:hypothetical protein